MIAEINKPSRSFEAALIYNFKKVEKNLASILDYEYMDISMETGVPTYEQALIGLKSIIPPYSRTKNPVFHVSINPHPDDKLKDTDLMDIAREYMEKMGYGEQPFIVFKHFDISREHIHIVSSRVKNDGCKIDHKFERYKSQRIIDELEQKYKLISKQQNKKDVFLVPKPIEYGKGNITQNMEKIIRYVMNTYSFQSLGEMNLALARFNLQAEKSKHYKNNREYEGLFYYIIDKEGNKIDAKSIISSEIGKGVGLAAISKHFQKSKQDSQTKIINLRYYIDEILKTRPSKDEFLDALNRNGIQCILRYTEDKSRIYGVTFLSDEIGIVANGSKLGKKYSANAINEIFNPSQELNLENEKDIINNNSIMDLSKEQEQTEITEIIDIIDIPTINLSDNSQFLEDIWQRKLRKKTKKKKNIRKR